MTSLLEQVLFAHLPLMLCCFAAPFAIPMYLIVGTWNIDFILGLYLILVPRIQFAL